MGDRYRLKGGRVLNRSCVVNGVDHCNLRCRSCVHLSPVLPRYFVEPGGLYKAFLEASSEPGTDHPSLVETISLTCNSEHQQVWRDDFRSVRCHPTEDLIHPRLVGTTRVAMAKVESLLSRMVIEPAEQVLRSSGAFTEPTRKVQSLSSSRPRG